MHNLKELNIWRKSMEMATEVYRITENFPKEEKYGLTSQIRRSAVSVPSNIAEGQDEIQIKNLVIFLVFQMAHHTN